MDEHHKEIFDRLDKIPLSQARQEIKDGKYGDIGSNLYHIVSMYLSHREAEERDTKEEKVLFWSITSAVSAIAAAIFAFVALFH